MLDLFEAFLPLPGPGNAERHAEHAEVHRYRCYRWRCPPFFGVGLRSGTGRGGPGEGVFGTSVLLDRRRTPGGI